MDSIIPADHKVKLKESDKWDKYVDFARDKKKTMGHENDGNTNCIWCTWNNSQRISKGLGNNRKRGNHPDYSIIKVGHNTKKSSGDLRNHFLTQMWKTLKRLKY